MSSQVIIENDLLIISDFETDDEEIVSYFKEVEPEKYEACLKSILKIGISALKTIGTTERVDYVEKEFERLKNKFDKTLESTNEELNKNIECIFGETGSLPSLMNDHFGDNGKIKAVITEFFGPDGVLIKELFDPVKEGTPICHLRSLLMEELDRIKQELGIKEKEEELIQKTTLKGEAFEDEAEVLLSDIVRTKFGDELERTTTEVGKITNSKKGDFVIRINGKPNCKIVLETKDWSSMSLPKIHEEIDQSLENREANYGIFVSKWVDPLPKSVGCFNFYRNDRIVCALGHKDDGVIHPEMLELAYCWARTQLLKDSMESKDVDIEKINTKIDLVKDKLKSFRNLKTQCSNIESASEKIRDLSDDIKSEITECMEAIWAELNSGSKES